MGGNAAPACLSFWATYLGSPEPTRETSGRPEAAMGERPRGGEEAMRPPGGARRSGVSGPCRAWHRVRIDTQK